VIVGRALTPRALLDHPISLDASFPNRLFIMSDLMVRVLPIPLTNNDQRLKQLLGRLRPQILRLSVPHPAIAGELLKVLALNANASC
jgi:hypothetical protein